MCRNCTACQNCTSVETSIVTEFAVGGFGVFAFVVCVVCVVRCVAMRRASAVDAARDDESVDAGPIRSSTQQV